mgnify:CR=1 FL=1
MPSVTEIPHGSSIPAFGGIGDVEAGAVFAYLVEYYEVVLVPVEYQWTAKPGNNIDELGARYLGLDA